MEIREWLEGLGLGSIADVFEDEQVRVDDVHELTDADLRELGLPLGPRKRILKAVAALTGHVEPASPDQSAGASDQSNISEADRRAVTVLFADLCGFTSLGERLDAEELRSLQNDLLGEIAPIIKAFGGFLEKFVGDAVLAIFGAPIAHEDDPARALRAALAVQEQTEKLNRRWAKRLGEPLALHMGVSTGTVIAGAIGSADANAYAVTGDTVNTASRLLALASGGEILVGPITYQMTAHLFTFAPLDAVAVKGKSVPVKPYRLVGVQELGAPRPGLASLGLTSLIVARQRELSQLRDAFEYAKGGQAQVVRVFSEAGCGKTRLVKEFLSQLGGAIRDENIALCQATCSSLGDQTFGVLARLLSDRFAIEANDSGETVREKFSAALTGFGAGEQEIAAMVPYLAFVLRIGTDDEIFAQLEPDQLKRQIFVAALSLFEHQLKSKPLLAVVEDLHWADAASIELLRYLVDRLDDRPFMLVLTHRSDFEASALAAGRTSQTAIRLASLSRNDSETLIAGLFGSAGVELPGALKNSIIERAGGNPLYVEEIVRSMIESGVLVREKNGWRCLDTIASVDVPLTIQGLLMSRLDRLPSEVRPVAQEASVLGIEFASAILKSISETPSLTESAIDFMRDAELIRESSTTRSLYGEAEHQGRRYRFTHALVQEVAYQNLLRAQRERLHGRAGEALLKVSGGSPNRLEEIEALAHHFSLSTNKVKGIGYLVEAGDWARRLHANDDALRHYRRGLALAETTETMEPESLIVLERLADVLGATGHRDEALSHYKELIDRISQTEDSAAEARLRRKIAALHWEAGARSRANSELEKALSLLKSGDHSLERAFLYHEMGRLAFRSGENEHAKDWAKRAIEQAQPLLEDDIQGERSTIIDVNASAATVMSEAYNTLGVAQARLGQFAEAISNVERSLAIAEANDLTHAMCRACANLGVLYGSQDAGHAIEISNLGLQVAKRIGHLGFQSSLYTNLGVALCTFHVRSDKDGIEALKKSIELDRYLNLVDHMPMSLIALGQIYQCHGQPRAAIRYFSEALTLAEPLNEPQILFPCYEGLATALLDVDDLAGAKNYLAKSRNVCDQAGIDPKSLLTIPFLC
jgi:adenylate cyclase